MTHAFITNRHADSIFVVETEKKVAFTWSTFVDKATLDDFKSHVFEYSPKYDHDEHLEIFLYNGHPRPARLRSDEDLRKDNLHDHAGHIS
jgi:hypothetical protein